LRFKINFSSIYSFRTPRPKEPEKIIEDDFTKVNEEVKEEDERPYKPKMQWPAVFLNTFIHFGSIIGFYQMLTLQPKWQTYIWCKYHKCNGIFHLK
jgi:hypothetical protein